MYKQKKLSLWRQITTIVLCSIVIFSTACASSSPQTPTNMLQPPTLTAPPLTESPVPPVATSTMPAPPTLLPPETAAYIENLFENMEKQSLFSGSVLIAQQGKVLVSQGYGLADREKHIANTAQTRFRIGSITKQFSAMAILILESQGKLKAEDEICQYIEDCPVAWEKITIHNLLTHTSGIPNFTDLLEFQRARTTPSTPIETIARFRDLPLDFQPGAEFSYSNSGYIVLGYIIEQISGKSYEEFLKEYIFSPLKLSNTGYNHNGDKLATGYNSQYSSFPADYIDLTIPYAAGALYSTVEDLYNWEQALYTDQLVPETYLDEMFTQQVLLPDNPVLGYGYGWFVWKGIGPRSEFHSGRIDGFSSYIIRYPDDEITIILLSNNGSANFDTLLDILKKKIFGRP